MNVEKIKEFYENTANKGAFFEKIGIPKQTFVDIITEKSNPRVITLEKIAKYFGKNVGYFFDEEALIRQEHGIPLIPIEAVAGYGEDTTGVKYEDCELYRVPEFIEKGAEFLIRVSGSSMYPKYSNGDILACKRIRDILFFQWGKIYVIDSSQGQLVKRVFECPSEDYILLVSDNNEKYPPFTIPKTDIRSLSIVLGVVRME